MKRLFPGMKYLRMDQDTTKTKSSHDEILYQFKQNQANILLGTQMISKGLDFENVTLVGVILADIGLSIPDFRSSERIFQSPFAFSRFEICFSFSHFLFTSLT